MWAKWKQQRRIKSCSKSFLEKLQKYVPMPLDDIHEIDPAHKDKALADALDNNRKSYNLRIRQVGPFSNFQMKYMLRKVFQKIIYEKKDSK